MKSINDLILSLEEEEAKIEVSDSTSTGGELDVVEEIQADSETEGLTEDQATADSVVDAIDTTEEEAEAAVSQIEANEEILSNPEGATEEQVAAQVAASTEALNDALLTLGGKRLKNANKKATSMEGIETNIEKLRYATEGLKDFAKNAWEKIKELFQKFIMFFKRLSVKIGAWFDQGEKRAKAFIKRIKNMSSGEGGPNRSVTLTEEAAERLQGRMEAWLVLAGSKSINDLVSKSEKIVEGNSTDFLKIDFKALQSGNLQTFQSFTDYAKYVNYSPDYDKEEGEKGLFAFPIGRSVHFLSSFGNVEVEEVDFDMAKALQNFIVKAPDMISIAENTSKYAKGYQRHVTNTFKSLDKALKEAEKDKGNDLKGSDYEDKVDIRKDFNRLYKVLTKSALLNIKSYQSAVQSNLGLLSALTAAFSGKAEGITAVPVTVLADVLDAFQQTAKAVTGHEVTEVDKKVSKGMLEVAKDIAVGSLKFAGQTLVGAVAMASGQTPEATWESMKEMGRFTGALVSTAAAVAIEKVSSFGESTAKGVKNLGTGAVNSLKKVYNYGKDKLTQIKNFCTSGKKGIVAGKHGKGKRK